MNGLTGPFIGRALDRFGPRTMMPLGALVLAGGLVLTSRTGDLVQFYLFYGIITSIGIALLGTVPNWSVIQNWFVRKRGTAMGIAAAGIGFAQFILVPFAQQLITTVGWRDAYVILAGLVLATILPLTILFQRHRPQDMGLLPDGDVAPALCLTPKPGTAGRDADSQPWTVGRALHTREFWLLFFGFAAAILVNQTVLVHQAGAFKNVGYGATLTAIIFGVSGAAGAVGKVAWGAISDRIGRAYAYTVAMGIYLIGLAMMLLITDASQPILAYAFAIFFGIGYGSCAPLFPATVADKFHGKSFGAIYGVIQIGISIGSGAGPLIAGYIFDVAHDYTLAWLLSMAALVISAACIWAAMPPRSHVRKA